MIRSATIDDIPYIVNLANKESFCLGFIPKMAYETATDPIAYLDQLNGYIYVSRQQLPQDTELQNILDEIVALIDSTLYKLRFLK